MGERESVAGPIASAAQQQRRAAGVRSVRSTQAPRRISVSDVDIRRWRALDEDESEPGVSGELPDSSGHRHSQTGGAYSGHDNVDRPVHSRTWNDLGWYQHGSGEAHAR